MFLTVFICILYLLSKVTPYTPYVGSRILGPGKEKIIVFFCFFFGGGGGGVRINFRVVLININNFRVGSCQMKKC